MKEKNRYDINKKVAEKRYKEYLFWERQLALLLHGLSKTNPRYYGQPGRFKKQKPYDCGKPRCWICHEGKFSPRRRPTRKEKIALLKMKEGYLQANDIG